MMNNMNILTTQQKILHLFTKSETTLQDLVTVYKNINESNRSINTHNNHKKIIKNKLLLKTKGTLNNEKQKIINIEICIAKEASKILWQNSQLSTPINEVVSAIQIQPFIITGLETSLNTLDKLLNALSRDINNQCISLKTDSSNTQNTIHSLHKKNDQLKKIKTQIHTKKSLVIHETNKKIATKNKKHIDHTKKSMKIVNEFIETGYKENQLIAEINKEKKGLYAKKELNKKNCITYKDKDNAIYLLNKMQYYINSIKERIMKKSDVLLKTKINDLENEINTIFNDEFKYLFNKSIKRKFANDYCAFTLPIFVYNKHTESLPIKNLILVGIKEKKSIHYSSHINNKALNTLNSSWGKTTYRQETKHFMVNIKKIKDYIQDDMISYTHYIDNYHKKFLEDNVIKKINNDSEDITRHINTQQNKLIIISEQLTQHNEKTNSNILQLKKINNQIIALKKNIKAELINLKFLTYKKAENFSTA